MRGRLGKKPERGGLQPKSGGNLRPISIPDLRDISQCSDDHAILATTVQRRIKGRTTCLSIVSIERTCCRAARLTDVDEIP